MRTNRNNLLSGTPLVTTIIISIGLLRLPDVSRADCVPPPPGLVAWWPGNGNANDIIGTNNGTLLGNATATGTGMVGQAFSLDGVNASVNAGTNSLFDFSGGSADFTIEAWVKPAALPSFSTGFASKSVGDFDGWVFGIFSGGNLVFSGCGYWYVDSGPAVVVAGVWSHVAVTHAGGTYTLYCNGSQVGSGSGGTWTCSPAPLQFGINPPRPNYYGLLDEVSIYNRALSSNEVAAIYAAGSAGKCSASACASLAIDLYAGISVEGTVGAAHRLEYVSNVGDTNWATLTNIILPQSPYLLFDPDSPRWARRFYRVQCAAAAGLVALGDALFDGSSDQFPTNSYRPLPAGVRTYEGYGSLAGYTLSETISYGESVAGVAAARVHFASTVPGDEGSDFWYGRDVHGDIRFLKSMSGGVVVWEASATVTAPLGLPQSPVLDQCWPSYADGDYSVRDLNAAAQGFSGLLKVREVGADDSIQYNFYELGVGRVVIQTSADPTPTGSGWKVQ